MSGVKTTAKKLGSAWINAAEVMDKLNTGIDLNDWHAQRKQRFKEYCGITLCSGYAWWAIGPLKTSFYLRPYVIKRWIEFETQQDLDNFIEDWAD